uniref:hypothetical protein n=1 Tax=Escherichia coli TaxID=562 RepID=UPI001BC83356
NAARTWVVFFAADPQVLKRVKDEMQETINSNSVRIKRMGELASSAEQKQLIADISAQRSAFQAQRNALLKRKEAGEDVNAEVL